jgi:hypothetical protein
MKMSTSEYSCCKGSSDNFVLYTETCECAGAQLTVGGSQGTATLHMAHYSMEPP